MEDIEKIIKVLKEIKIEQMSINNRITSTVEELQEEKNKSKESQSELIKLHDKKMENLESIIERLVETLDDTVKIKEKEEKRKKELEETITKAKGMSEEIIKYNNTNIETLSEYKKYIKNIENKDTWLNRSKEYAFNLGISIIFILSGIGLYNLIK